VIPHDLAACCEYDLASHRALVDASRNIVLRNPIGTVETALRASFLLTTSLMENQPRTLSVRKAMLESLRVRIAAGPDNVAISNGGLMSAPAVCCALNTGRSPMARRMCQIDPERAFAVGPINGLCGPDCGRRRNAPVVPFVGQGLDELMP
jgi:hypothetical protein